MSICLYPWYPHNALAHTESLLIVADPLVWDNRPPNLGGQHLTSMPNGITCASEKFAALAGTEPVGQDLTTLMIFCKYAFPQHWDPNGNGNHFAKPVEELVQETFQPDVTFTDLSENIAKLCLGHYQYLVCILMLFPVPICSSLLTKA